MQAGPKQQHSAQALQENTIYELQMQADQAALKHAPGPSRAHGRQSFSLLAVDEFDEVHMRLRACSSEAGVTGDELSSTDAYYASVTWLPLSLVIYTLKTFFGLCAGMPANVPGKSMILQMTGSDNRLGRRLQGPAALCARALEVFQRAAAGQLGSTGQCHVSTRGALGHPRLDRSTLFLLNPPLAPFRPFRALCEA